MRFGRLLTLDNPEFQVVSDDTEVLHAGRIVPVYPLTAGLTSARLRGAIREALDRAGYAYPEYLPQAVRDEEDLIGIAPAGLRRALRAPARHGRAAPPAGPRCGAADRARARRGRRCPDGADRFPDD